MSTATTDNLLSELIDLRFEPKDLEEQLGPNFAQFRAEELTELNSLFDQNAIAVKGIVVVIGKNEHISQDTYSCEISLVSDSPESDFKHYEEGTDYQGNVRKCVKKTVEYIRRKKEKLQDRKHS
jgi:hypothetical protein